MAKDAKETTLRGQQALEMTIVTLLVTTAVAHQLITSGMKTQTRHEIEMVPVTNSAPVMYRKVFQF